MVVCNGLLLESYYIGVSPQCYLKRKLLPIHLLFYSIAVFGQPGSGKTFGIKEAAKSILLDHGYQREDTRPLEFNISLMSERTELICAFQTIREKQLSRKVPIVLFDEFDSQGGRWLEYFLEPMENGMFTDDDGSHPLGRGIYVFIGGTSKTMGDFRCKQGNAADATTSNLSTNDAANNNVRSQPEAQANTKNVNYIDYPLGINRVSLSGLFHKMRDTTIRGRLPIVLIHGFTQRENWGWVQEFLSPMQDSLFLDNGQTRPIGQGIFVFIQTSNQRSLPNVPDDGQNYDDSFVNAKGPDFLSRLRGRVEIREDGEMDLSAFSQVIKEYMKTDNRDKPLSICVTNVKADRVNEIKEKLTNLRVYDVETRTTPDSYTLPAENLYGVTFLRLVKAYVDIKGPNPVDNDRISILRRAILLRSLLQRRVKAGKKEKINIQSNVLNALLYVDRYHHGARSMEAILAMSALSEYQQARGFTQQHLPAFDINQLSLHVDESQFKTQLEAPDNGAGQPAGRLGGATQRRYTEQHMMRMQVGLPWSA